MQLHTLVGVQAVFETSFLLSISGTAGPGEPHCAVAHHDVAYHDPHIHPGELAFGTTIPRWSPVAFGHHGFLVATPTPLIYSERQRALLMTIYRE